MFYSFDDFSPLIEIVCTEMKKQKYFTNGHILAVMTSKNELYRTVIREVCTMCAADTDIELVNNLAERNDSHATKIICMFADGTLDLPSAIFRRKLISINENNKDAEILLHEEGRFVCKKLSETL